MAYGWHSEKVVPFPIISSCFLCGKQKEGWTLPLLSGGCSNSCCETITQEGAKRTANISRLENLNGSTSHCRLGQIQSFERANTITSSLAELYLLAPNKLGLGRSLSLSLCHSFVIICRTFQEMDTWTLTHTVRFFLFCTFKGLCLVILFEGNSISKLKGDKPVLFFNQRYFFFFPREREKETSTHSRNDMKP